MMNESNKTQIFFKLKLLLNYWELYACVYNEDTAEGQRSCFLRLAKLFNRQLNLHGDVFTEGWRSPLRKQLSFKAGDFITEFLLFPVKRALGPAPRVCTSCFWISESVGWNRNLLSDGTRVVSEGPDFLNGELDSAALTGRRRNTQIQSQMLPLSFTRNHT